MSNEQRRPWANPTWTGLKATAIERTGGGNLRAVRRVFDIPLLLLHPGVARENPAEWLPSPAPAPAPLSRTGPGPGNCQFP